VKTLELRGKTSTIILRGLLWTCARALVALLAFVTLLAICGRAHAAESPTARETRPVASGTSPRDPRARVRRFALIASSNDGGSGRTRLRFADSDGRAITDVLRQLGGLAPQDLVVVTAANRANLDAAFARLRAQVATAATPGLRRELFVYYSGHSDEEGLLMGGQRMGYRELRDRIDGVGAEVRIAVLDSCASGALIRLKGGTFRAPFLSDVAADARGHAFLTASSADEAAQESERLGAAFFTHYLVSGMRGAADASRDGKVTLSEAYQFAYHETLRRTERTQAGAQHPAYDIQMAGTGDLVITDLRATSSGLVLNRDVVGRVYIRDEVGRLLVELHKEPLYPVEIGLSPGRYKITVDSDGRIFESRVELADGDRSHVAQGDLAQVAVVATISRGDAVVATADGELKTYSDVGFDFVLAPKLRLVGPKDRPVRDHFVLGVVGHSDALDGAQVSIAGNLVEDDMKGIQLAPFFNMARGNARGVQLSGGANLTGGDVSGAQLATINMTVGHVTGLQLSSGNYAGTGVRGLQLGAVNIARGLTDGAQMAAANTAEHVKGLQLGAVNVATGVLGLQLAAVNVGGAISGAQIGVINVARTVRGAQFGVINVADDVDGASVGLLPLVRNGYKRLAFWTSDVTYANLGFKLGARRLYTLLGGGVSAGDAAPCPSAAPCIRATDRTTYAVHFGFGLHTAFAGTRFFLDAELFATQFGTRDDFADRAAVLGTARLVLGYQLARHFAVFGGLAFNVHTAWDGKDYAPGLGFLENVERDGEATVRMFPGFVLGAQI
jgi:hypothetical protein